MDDINNTTNIREGWCGSSERNVIRVREMVSENGEVYPNMEGKETENEV